MFGWATEAKEPKTAQRAPEHNDYNAPPSSQILIPVDYFVNSGSVRYSRGREWIVVVAVATNCGCSVLLLLQATCFMLFHVTFKVGGEEPTAGSDSDVVPEPQVPRYPDVLHSR